MRIYNSKRFKWGVEKRYARGAGPSAKLLVSDMELQEHVIEMREKGVKLLACKKRSACTEFPTTSDDLV